MKTLDAARALSFKRAIRITILHWRWHGTFKRERHFYSHWAISTFCAKKTPLRFGSLRADEIKPWLTNQSTNQNIFIVCTQATFWGRFARLNVGNNELWDRSSHLPQSGNENEVESSALSTTKMAAWKPRELFCVIAGDWALNMDRKDSDVHDNFFASLNQLILSLEPAIKEAGSVAAAEDILTHLEATDENFHRFVLTHWNVSKLAAFLLNVFVFAWRFSSEVEYRSRTSNS